MSQYRSSPDSTINIVRTGLYKCGMWAGMMDGDTPAWMKNLKQDDCRKWAIAYIAKAQAVKEAGGSKERYQALAAKAWQYAKASRDDSHSVSSSQTVSFPGVMAATISSLTSSEVRSVHPFLQTRPLQAATASRNGCLTARGQVSTVRPLSGQELWSLCARRTSHQQNSTARPSPAVRLPRRLFITVTQPLRNLTETIRKGWCVSREARKSVLIKPTSSTVQVEATIRS